MGSKALMYCHKTIQRQNLARGKTEMISDWDEQGDQVMVIRWQVVQAQKTIKVYGFFGERACRPAACLVENNQGGVRAAGESWGRLSFNLTRQLLSPRLTR